MIFVTFVFAIIDQSYDIIMIQNLFSNYIILTFLEKKNRVSMTFDTSIKVHSSMCTFSF